MKQILVCGDSFMAKDTPEYKGQHWSEKLDESFRVVNIAQPGASNTMIAKQFIDYVHKVKWDAIVIGFTNPNRYPISCYTDRYLPYVTDCWQHKLTKQQIVTVADFKDNVFTPMMAFNDYIVIRYCLQNIAALAIPYVWTLGPFEDALAGIEDKHKFKTDFAEFEAHKHTMNLDNFKPHLDRPSFHIADQTVQQQFADVCTQMIGV